MWVRDISGKMAITPMRVGANKKNDESIAIFYANSFHRKH